MADHDGAAEGSASLEALLRKQAEELTRLRVERGNPPLRAIASRAGKLFEREKAALPIATQSTAFAGGYVGLDRLMWLVRTLMSWDEYGGDCPPPDRRAPELDPWRARWTAITHLRVTRRKTAPDPPPPMSPPSRPRPPMSPPSPVTTTLAVQVKAGLRSTDAQATQDSDPSTLLAGPPGYATEPQLVHLPSPLSDLAVSPDGRVLATGSKDGTMRLWNPATGKQFGDLNDHTGQVTAAVFSPDGTVLAAGDTEGPMVVWRAPDWRATRFDGRFGRVRAVAFSPDGSLLAVADDKADNWPRRAWLVDPATGNPVGRPLNHPRPVRAVAFSPDGHLLVTSDSTGVVRLWDPATGEQVGEPLAPSAGAWAVAFSPDGLLATGGRSVGLWHLVTRKQVGEPLDHPAGVSAVVFAPDGLLVTGDTEGVVRWWDGTRTRSEALTVRTGRPAAVALSADGRLLATGEGRTVLLYHRHVPPPAAPPPPQRSLAQAMALHAVRTAHQVMFPLPASHRGSVWSLAFSPDGSLLATGGEDKTVWLWDPVTHERVGNLRGYTAGVVAVGFSPDGNLLATGSSNGEVRLWTVSADRP